MTLKALRKSVSKQMAEFSKCPIVKDEVRVPTTCVLPYFDFLYVHVAQNSDSYLVHDNGQALDNILRHGQELDVANRVILSKCRPHGLKFNGWRISWENQNQEWLSSGIFAVAAAVTASAECALHETFMKALEAQQDEIADTIFLLLEPSLEEGSISRRYQHRGKSGRHYEFDLAVKHKNRLTLIETVTPHGHSVSSKYVALADVPSEGGIRKIVAHDNNLSKEDIVLLRNVAAVAKADDIGRMLT